jgi:integron integrase
MMDDIPRSIPPGSLKLMDSLRTDLRARGYALTTERTYLHWIRRFIFFHRYRSPLSMGKPEIEEFLNHLAVQAGVAPATQRIALNALMYPYVKFYGRDAEELVFTYAKPTRRLPSVLTHAEIQQILSRMNGTPKLMVELLYGSGLRLQECLNLRVKDIDFNLQTLTVRQGKGDKDRVTLLPQSLNEPLPQQITAVLAIHQQDISNGFGQVYLPHALERKNPSAARSPAWQYLFPSSRIGADPRSGVLRRHHIHQTALRKQLPTAVFTLQINRHTFLILRLETIQAEDLRELAIKGFQGQ